MVGRNFFFCSSLPWTIRLGPTIDIPMPPTLGARASAISSLMMNCCMRVKAAPPYSFGHDGAIHPRSTSFLRHVCMSG
jgi:hypothetical protein